MITGSKLSSISAHFSGIPWPRYTRFTRRRTHSRPAILRFQRACHQELVKLQAGNKEGVDISNEVVALSMQDFEHMYGLLDIHFEQSSVAKVCLQRSTPGRCWNSFSNPELLEVSESAVLDFFRDIPKLADKPCIIRKRDGGFNYATTDVATVNYRLDDLKGGRVAWYIISAPQNPALQTMFRGYTATGLPSRS